jgi:hypothetical protein
MTPAIRRLVTLALVALVLLGGGLAAIAQTALRTPLPRPTEAQYVAAAQTLVGLACYGQPSESVVQQESSSLFRSGATDRAASSADTCSGTFHSKDISALRSAYDLIKGQVHTNAALLLLQPADKYFDDLGRANPQLKDFKFSNPPRGNVRGGGGLQPGTLGPGGTSLPAGP